MLRPRLVLLLSLALCLLASAGLSQSLKKTRSVMVGVPGAFRSFQSGNWSDILTWEYFDGSNWVGASWTPADTDKTIEIQSGDTVVVSISVPINETTIDAGGVLIVKPSATLTVSDTVGTDLSIDGRLLNQGTLVMDGSATWAVNSGGWYIHNTSSGISTPLNSATIDAASYFEYLDSGTPSIAGRTYGNLRFTTASAKTYTNTGSSALTVNGYLLIASGVAWNTGGYSGNITVHGNTTVGGTWTGSGSGDQGTHTFYGTFSVSSTGTYSLATTGATQGGIYFQGDLYNDGTFSTPSNRYVSLNSEGSITIDGSSPILFGNGFTSSVGVEVAPGATVQVASGKTLEIQNDLSVNRESELSYGTISGPGTITFQGWNDTFTNNGVVDAATTFYNSEGGNYQIAGEGTWGDVIIEEGVTVYANGDVTMKNVDMTVNGVLNTATNELRIQGASGAGLSVGSTGSVIGTPTTVKTEGTVTIVQDGTFSESLDVLSGTTTASGANSFGGAIIVENGATLTVPSGQSLRAENSVNVNTGGAINGSGTFYYDGSGGSELAFTNNGTVAAPAVFEEIAGGEDYSIIAGTGVWSNLTFAAGSQVHLWESVSLSSSNVTNHGYLEIYGYAFTMDGGTFTNASDGHVHGTFDSFETQEAVTLTQSGEFDETLVVVSGTTTTSGVFQQPIIVHPDAILNIPTGTTLTAQGDITVQPVGGIFKIAPTTPKGKTKEPPRVASSSAGVISGGGTLLFTANGGTFTNDGIVDVATTFQNNGGDIKNMTVMLESGHWKSVTIAASCSTTVSGAHTFTGSGTPFVVNGSVTLTGSTIDYGGNAAQTVAPLSYDNLEITNASADVALGGATTVGGALTISGHNLTTGAYTLTLGGAATITETAPYSVLGTLTTTRSCSSGSNQTFGGMGVEINAAGSAPGGTTVTRATGTAPSFPPGVPIKRYFDITPTTNSGLNATFVFHYAASELNGNTESGLSLYRSTDGGTSWTQEGGTVSTGAHTITLTSVDELSRWIAGGSTPEHPAPAVIGVEPSTVALGTTTTLTLTGDDFYDGVSSPQFGSGIVVNSFSVVSSGEISVNITVDPAAPVGAQDISVTNSPPGGGTATLTNGLTLVYPSPSLTSVTPGLVERGQTLDVNLNGTGFYSATTAVSFGADITVNSVSASGTTNLTANITVGINAATGPRSVTVTNAAPGGGTATLANALTIANPAPTLVGISPNAGIRGQTLDVTVTGTNFLVGVTSCSYGDGITVNSVSSVTSTQVTANVTIDLGASPGTRDITVTNAAPGGGTATLAGAFSITNPAPTVSGVSPGQAGRGSKLTVVVTGTDFLEGVSSVSFGADITVNSTSITSSTQMTVDISIGASASTGSRTVTVTNAAPGGGSASLPSGFTVDNSPATGVENIVGVVPNDYVLREAYPNPFNPSTTIGYGLPERSKVKLEVYNMLGNTVAVLVDGERSKGFYEVEWVAGNLPSGVYLIRLHSESLESSRRILASRKVVLVK